MALKGMQYRCRNKPPSGTQDFVFETEAELDTLQRLLDSSFENAKERMTIKYGSNQRLSATQLAGFRGVKLLATGSVNSQGEPRVAPRSATFLHGKFYLAANVNSTMVRRLWINPKIAVSYFENHLLLMGHGTVGFIRKDESSFSSISPEWKKAFEGGRNALDGIDVLLRVDATNLVAFAQHPERYPDNWTKPRR